MVNRKVNGLASTADATDLCLNDYVLMLWSYTALGQHLLNLY